MMEKSKKTKSRRRRRREPGEPPLPAAGQQVRIVDGISFHCPSCGLKVDTGFDQHDRPVGIHRDPACEIFLKLELDEYVKWARQTITGAMDS